MFFKRWISTIPEQGIPAVNDAGDDARLEMACALTFGMERKAEEFGLDEHCGRVVRLVGELCDVLAVDDAGRRLVTDAALLHEVGMIAVAPELLRRQGRLTAAELRTVREHAAIGAEIARGVRGDGVARIIAAQFDDAAEALARGLSEQEVLLAGILRVADMADAMTHPRPYQPALDLTATLAAVNARAGVGFDARAALALGSLRTLASGQAVGQSTGRN